MTSTSSKSLYARDLGNRPLLVLGGAGIVAALVTLVAVNTGIWPIIAGAVLIAAAGLAGFLTASTRIEVTPGRVVCASRRGERGYDASDLTLTRGFSAGGSGNTFVLAPTGHARKVICTFADDDVDDVLAAFAAAGVSIEQRETKDGASDA